MRSPKARKLLCALRGAGLPLAEAEGSGRNPVLDGGRGAAGLEGPKIGRGNGNLGRDVVVAYAYRTDNDRKILAGDLRLGQIIADRAVRFIASPIIPGHDLWAPGNEHPQNGESVVQLMMNVQDRVQARSGKRYCRQDSGEEPSHNRIGEAMAISQGETDNRIAAGLIPLRFHYLRHSDTCQGNYPTGTDSRTLFKQARGRDNTTLTQEASDGRLAIGNPRYGEDRRPATDDRRSVLGPVSRASIPPPSAAGGRDLIRRQCASIHTMWMRFAIDVAMLDFTGRTLAVRHAVRPWRLVFAPRGTHAVLEASAGTLPPWRWVTLWRFVLLRAGLPRRLRWPASLLYRRWLRMVETDTNPKRQRGF